MAREQAVEGLIAAALTPDTPSSTPLTPSERVLTLSLSERALAIEAQNLRMNAFVGRLFTLLKEHGVEAVLVKGQGIGQCYHRPLWRGSGDVDLFLSASQYAAAKALLVPLAARVEPEDAGRLHLGLWLASDPAFEVELHGTLRSGLGRRVDKVLDFVQASAFAAKRFRTWSCEGVSVPLLAPDDDVFFVFVHILQHFFRGGIGLRQVCDWCRLLYTFAGQLDVALLSRRLRAAGLLPLWQAFGAIAVTYLGMPEEAMPLATGCAGSCGSFAGRRPERILAYIMEVGNFGRNRSSAPSQYPYLIRKVVSFFRQSRDLLRLGLIFPGFAFRVWAQMLFAGVARVFRDLINFFGPSSR